MKIKLLHIGKPGAPFEAIVREYSRKISLYADFELISVKQARHLPIDSTVKTESERLLANTENRDFVVALSEEGKQKNSLDFAEFLAKTEQSARPIAFLIGGAYGLSAEAKARANLVLSMSQLTFQHDIALVVALEQIYRAMTILRGEEYHKQGI